MIIRYMYCRSATLHSTVGSTSDCRSSGCKFEFQSGHIIYMEIDHEINSTVILAFLLIQEGHLLVIGKNVPLKY